MLNRLQRWITSRGRNPGEDFALARLREALDALPEGLAFYDADDRIVIWNRHYAELTQSGAFLKAGAPFRELLQVGLGLGIYPEAEGREEEWLEERLALRRSGQNTFEQENRGHWLRILERRTADGGVVSICEDITELKQREASLRLIFEGSPVPMWVVDVETWRFLAVNEAAIAQYGYSREEFLGKQLFDLYAQDEVEDLRRESKVAGAQGFYRSSRAWRQVKADGSEIFVTPFVNYIRYDDRPGVMAAQFDVTVSKRAEAAMALARDQAEAANRAKTEFLANMSHEIRTPLNGVVGVVSVLANTELSSAQKEMVGIVEGSARTLERLLSDVLDLARVEAGRVEIETEPFHLGDAIRATVALSNTPAREKGVELRLEMDPKADGAFEGDETRLKQILGNLLSNAVKFTPVGSVTLRVRASETGAAPLFTFAVEDTGVGFDPACKERLFSRFEQEDGSVTRRFGGSGLGLAISRKLAEMMGGRLDAASTPGRGSVFTLELPLRRIGTGDQLESTCEADRPEDGLRPLRVLLAEDHAVNQKVVELMLHGMSVDMSCVENGEDAIAAVLAERFDVVLMDMQMPVLDGLSAIRRIREHERATGAPRTVIYTLSANAMREHELASAAAGADRHLSKPITAPVLIGALSELATELSQSEAA